VNNQETWLVYGLGGELIGEYAANASAASPQKEYGYRNGALLVTAEPSANIHWLVSDQLGTPRMIFDHTGSLTNTKRHDYLPFGEELVAGQGLRTNTLGYVADNIRQKFTQKERDNETGLDYFGARFYASSQGRFASPDPLLSSGTVENPQSWNRYSYVLNHPLELTDPFGLYVFDSSVGDPERQGFRAALSKARSNLWKIAATYGIKSKEYKDAARALNVYGAEGVKNGVTIRETKDPNAHPGGTQVAGVVGPKTADNPTGQSIQITFRSDMFEKQGLNQTIAHEGSHAADGSDWVASNFAQERDPTNYQTEFRAFNVGFIQVQADFNNKGEAWQFAGNTYKDPGMATVLPMILVAWDAAWKEADRATMRANNINELLARPTRGGGYNLTPTNQGGPAFNKGGRFK
jgi:RHS repeat-associated protein